MLIIAFTIFVLIMSAIFHEYAHGWVAYKLGDDTAKNAGRLTLNPISHLDPIGSILMPVLLIFSGAPFVLGWAKPVPYNPCNLRDAKYGDLKVAIGGPGTNFLIAVIFGLIARLTPISATIKQNLIMGFLTRSDDMLLSAMQGSFMNSIFILAIIVVFINLLLMIFNLIPIPPLDGSKVLMTFLSTDWKIRLHRIEPFGIFIVLLLLISGLFSLIWYPLIFLFSLLIGV